MITTMAYRGEVENIYMRKPPCPRDLGYWYCQECRDETLRQAADADYTLPRISCGKAEGDRVCGETHLGYEWCQDCQRNGTHRAHAHKGEFEVVGQVRGEPC
jgi:hypothetical protein